MQKILNNLKGQKNQRRQFLIFSAEWHSDKTLEPLRQAKYEQHIVGVDCGEQSFKDSQWESEEQFFNNEIKMRCDFATQGTVIVFDDLVDQTGSVFTRQLVNRLLRVARHQGLTIMMILHNLRSGSFSTQAHSSVKYLTVFPRSQKAKIVNFLNRDLGIPLAAARDHVFNFGQTGRIMSIRLHAPEMLIGEKLLRLL